MRQGFRVIDSDLTRQIDYVRGSVSPALQHTPVEYARMVMSSAASALGGSVTVSCSLFRRDNDQEDVI